MNHSNFNLFQSAYCLVKKMNYSDFNLFQSTYCLVKKMNHSDFNLFQSAYCLVKKLMRKIKVFKLRLTNLIRIMRVKNSRGKKDDDYEEEDISEKGKNKVVSKKTSSKKEKEKKTDDTDTDEKKKKKKVKEKEKKVKDDEEDPEELIEEFAESDSEDREEEKKKTKKSSKTVKGGKPTKGKKGSTKTEGEKKKHKPDSNILVEFETNMTGEIKNIFNMLSHIIVECQLIFIPPIAGTKGEKGKKNTNKPSRGGLRIIKLGNNGSILVNLALYADAFDKFYCAERKVVAGVDLSQLNLRLDTFNDNSSLSLYMLKNDRNVIHCKSSHTKDEIIEKTGAIINLTEVESELAGPETDEVNEINREAKIPAQTFTSTLKKILKHAELVIVTMYENKFCLTGKNETGETQLSLETANSEKKKDKQILQDTYNIKNLIHFTRASKFCDMITITLAESYPMILVMPIRGGLGTLKALISGIEIGSSDKVSS